MSQLRLLACFLMVAFLAGTSLLADDKKSADEPKKDPPATGHLPSNWKKLGLTDDQVKKVYRIETEYRGKIEDLEQQVKDLKAKEHKAMMEVLTDAQKARLKELKEGDDNEKKPDDKKPDDKKPDDKKPDDKKGTTEKPGDGKS